EINSNSARLYTFHSLEEVLNVLEKMKQGDIPYVIQLPKQAGQKEQRVRHLFGAWVEEEVAFAEAMATEAGLAEVPTAASATPDLESRLETVERELAELKETVAKLLKELNG
ncbi:MAG TPA: DUF480 domain-containing protein, partial [Bacteroidia bacterium]|nr:DUF480 domain-containing protein [Bacteroidia bacterium]